MAQGGWVDGFCLNDEICQPLRKMQERDAELSVNAE